MPRSKCCPSSPLQFSVFFVFMNEPRHAERQQLRSQSLRNSHAYSFCPTSFILHPQQISHNFSVGFGCGRACSWRRWRMGKGVVSRRSTKHPRAQVGRHPHYPESSQGITNRGNYSRQRPKGSIELKQKWWQQWRREWLMFLIRGA